MVIDRTKTAVVLLLVDNDNADMTGPNDKELCKDSFEIAREVEVAASRRTFYIYMKNSYYSTLNFVMHSPPKRRRLKVNEM